MTHLTGHSSTMNPNVLHGLVGLVALLVVGSGMYFFAGSQKSASQSGKYCNDGALSGAKPIQSHRSYCLKYTFATQHLMPNEPVSYQFSIVDDEGNTVKDFQVAHDMLLHLIVVRKDLANFQHLHPNFDASTGTFTLSRRTFPTAGEYRIYADFVPTGAQMDADGIPLNVVLTQDVTVMGNYTPQMLKRDQATKTFDGYTVTLIASPKSLAVGTMDMLSFTIKKNGKPITDLQPYLAALGHSVIIREGTLDYIHAHAVQTPTATQNGTVDFHVEFPYGGTYKVFTQLKHQDKVVTTDFVVSVARDEPQPMQQMDHAMHQPQ